MKSARVLLTGPHWFGDLLPFCERALLELGLEVKVLPTNIASWLKQARNLSEKITRIPIAGPSLKWRMQRQQEHRLGRNINSALTRSVTEFSPDIILSILCWGDPISADALGQSHKPHKIGWLMDDPFQHSGSLAGLLRSYDQLYVVEDSWITPIRLITGRPVEALSCGADLATYRPLPSPGDSERGSCPIAFVGTSYKGQAAGLLRASLLESVSDLGLSIYGDEGWMTGDSIRISECYRGGELDSEQVNRVHNRADIVLNIHHPQFREGTSLRTFAICASRAFQLVDWTSKLDRYFEPEVEVATYRTPGELREKACFYLGNESARLRIAQAGYERVRREHSYSRRLAQMLIQAGVLSGAEASISLGSEGA